jgi:DNA transformation protein and related proteins
MPKPFSDFVLSLLDLLAPLGGVTAKRMFGGYGLYRDGLFFGIVVGEQLYLRVDEVTKPRFEERGLEPFTFTNDDGRKIVMKYHLAPEDAFSSSMRMKPWALLAVEAAKRVETAKSAKKTRKAKVAKKKNS